MVIAAIGAYADAEVIYQYKDSAKIGDGCSYYVFEVQLEEVEPEAREVILKVANKYINKIMQGEDKKPVADVIQLAKQEAKTFFADNRKEFKEIEKDGGFYTPWYNECTFVIYQVNAEFFTIEYYGDTMMGGAHGNPFFGGQTFRIDNGGAWTWDNMFTNKDEVRQCILENGVCEDNDLDWDDVYSYTDTNEKTFPLPNGTPYINRDASVIFQYNPYEIGPFALGAPSVRVGFYEIYDCLNPALRELMPEGEEEEYEGDELEGDIYPYDHPSQIEIYSTHELKDLASIDKAIYFTDEDREALAGRYVYGAADFLRANWPEGTPGENAMAQELITSMPQPLKASELYSYKKVRSLQLYDWGTIAYDYFPCKFTKADDYIIFEKLGGSQRLWGEVYRISDQALAFTGCWYIGGGKPTGFSDESKLMTGLFKKIADNKIIMVTCKDKSYEVFEFSK